MAKLELFGTARCPHTQEMREWLEWKAQEFVEYDVEADPEALARMRDLALATIAPFQFWSRMEKSSQVGWQGHRLHGGRRVNAMIEAQYLHRGTRRRAGRGISSVRLSPGAREQTDGLGVERGRRRRDSSRRRRTSLQAFVEDLKNATAGGRDDDSLSSRCRGTAGLHRFYDPKARLVAKPTVRISPDLPVCDDCVKELFDPANRRFGIRISTALIAGRATRSFARLPYDRANTTMERLAARCLFALPNTTILRIAAFTHSRWRARPAARIIVFTAEARIDADRSRKSFA